MKQLIKILILWIIVLPLFAQNEANIWYFGENAGIDFGSGHPVALTNGKLNTKEGCASISNISGKLLFYTDGRTVYNRNHVPMSNGSSLHGHYSSSQSAIIIPKPNSNTIYFIFTVDALAGAYGLCYSEVDMTLAGGLGDITSNKNIALVTPTCEKITALKHANDKDIWVITHEWGTSNFFAYIVTPSGVNTTAVISNVGTAITGDHANSAGYLRSSHDGRKIVSANWNIGNIEIFDFNKSTGILSNPLTHGNFQNYGPYGIEFSPNNRFLYITEGWGNNLYQYDLEAGSDNQIIKSRVKIATYSGYFGAIQIARDGKIYVAEDQNKYLGVINCPNKKGIECNFVTNGFHLNGKESSFGLPTFISTPLFSSFSYKGECIGDSTYFQFGGSKADSILWNFGEPASGSENISTLDNPAHLYQSEKTFTVTVKAYYGGITTSNLKNISIHSIPEIDLGKDTSLCLGSFTILDVSFPNSSYLWQDGSVRSTYIASDSGLYYVKVTNDCGSTSDSIILSFTDCSCNLFIPNAFSPNDDDKNEVFIPITNCNISNYKLLIFNNWGEQIFESVNINEGWNGNYNTQKSPEGVYFYILTANIHGISHEKRFGRFKLIR
ncbi:MAG: gliding motility-associated C-terminal domain-containing protein [Bacteroidota bacterium]|nr:gliding motility-associated C-terminal domain-containing protein [Bacteroidota bacterium]